VRVVGRRCVRVGVRGGCENRGVQVSDYSVCMSRCRRGSWTAVGAVGVGLMAAVEGRRVSSCWLDETGVLCVLAGCIGLLSICNRHGNGLSCVKRRSQRREWLCGIVDGYTV
jgi:hypothetical protein